MLRRALAVIRLGGNVIGQGIQRPGPKQPIVGKPIINLAQGTGIQTAAVNTTVNPPFDQPGAFEDPQMLGNRRQRHRKWPGQFRNHRRSSCQTRQQTSPGLITERAKHAIEPLLDGRFD